MLDDKSLDRMSFGQLNIVLDHILERIKKIEDESSGDHDDPRLDLLTVVANKVVVRMGAIIRQHGTPEAIAQWDKVSEGYEEAFEKYADFLLEEDTLLDLEQS